MSERPKTFLWLEEILEDPELLEPPRPTVPRLAWPERLTLLASREKGGKSTLAGAAAAAISSGRDFLGGKTVPGNVLIISLEEHASDFTRRLMKFGADPKRIAVISPSSDTSLVKAIWETAEYVKPSLIVWDTLGAFALRVAKKPLEPNDSQGWTMVMNEIVEVSRAYGASLLLHHTKKSDGKYRDSTAIGANVDVILEMRGEGAEPRNIKGVGRFEIEDTRFTMGPDGPVLIETEEQLQKRVWEFVAAHPNCSWQDLRSGVTARDKDVQQARDVLVKKGAIANVGKGQSHSYIATEPL